MAAKDCTPIGAIFGNLTVIGTPFRNGRRWKVACQCGCGKVSEPRCEYLVSGETKSCGCLAYKGGLPPRHGMTNTPTYRIYSGMLSRCRNPNRKAYADYGGRGIQVCDRWLEFENFYADMGPRPSPDHSLDRYPDSDGNYEPGNCRWATRVEQNNNRRGCVVLEHDGKRLTISQWSRESGIPESTLQRWHKQGLSPQEIFTRRK